MPLTRIKNTAIGDGGISTAKLADGAVTTVKVADSAVNSAKIGVDVIAAEDLAANSVTVSEISDGAVTGAKLVNNLNYDSGTLYLDSTNNRVAIGSTSSLEKLRVAGNIEVYNDDADGYIWFHDAGTRSWAVGSVQSTGKFSINYNQNFSSAERLTIDPNGFTSLNTTTGNERLNVNGAIGSSGASANFGAGDERIIMDFTGSVARVGHVNGASGSAKALQFLTAGSERMRITADGDIGIGVSSPYADLDIAVTAETGTANLADNGIRLEAAGVSVDSVIPITAGFVSNQDRMRCGIGFICQSKDAVAGYGGDIGFYARGAADGSALTVNDEKVRITDGGYLLVGATTNSGGTGPDGGGHLGLALADSGRFYTCTNSGGNLMEFYVLGTSGSVGSINVTTGGTSFNTSSDYRLKENVNATWDATTRLKQLNPVQFNFIADADNTVDGFLAHEVQDIIPDAITGTKDGLKVWQDGEELPDGVSVGDNKLDDDGNTIPDYQGIDQAKLVPLLVKSLQEALADIDTLKAEVAALKNA